jgi:hypothetical protein
MGRAKGLDHRIEVRVSAADAERLHAMVDADTTGELSVSSVIRRALREYMDREERAPDPSDHLTPEGSELF